MAAPVVPKLDLNMKSEAQGGEIKNKSNSVINKTIGGIGTDSTIKFVLIGGLAIGAIYFFNQLKNQKSSKKKSETSQKKAETTTITKTSEEKKTTKTPNVKTDSVSAGETANIGKKD